MWSLSAARVIRHTLHIVLLVCLGTVASGAWAAIADSIEFYNTITGRYFRSEAAGEVSIVDSGGAGPGWVRTGQTYKSWRTPADAPAGATPVCRFYSAGYGSHFYTASTGECSYVKGVEVSGRAAAQAAGQPYTGWQYEGIVAYALMPVAGKCPAGSAPIYRNYAGFIVNHRFSNNLPVYQDMNDKGWYAEGVNMCGPGVSTADQSDITRLLRQATFGPTDALMSRVQTIGINGWLDEQFAMTPSSYPVMPTVPFNPDTTCAFDGSKPASDPQNICSRDNYSLFQVQLAFYRNALNGQDQLRQRVAFALSQILVTSGVEINHAYGMAPYQQLMLDHAFGNFKDLLTAVTLSPAMGRYLDMANSNKPDPARGIAANENYAREIMQLFTIGLYQLNQDGTFVRDSKGALTPTYTQTTVENLARVFTGWTYANANGTPATRNNGIYYGAPMVAVTANHDTTSKTLLNGYVIPAGQTPATDLGDAITHLFDHPNVGPFIGKQLIQKLVTGDPSPAYVSRVAAVFNNNGNGVRGDLKAVVRAILTDVEARGDIKSAAGYGHLIEPVLLVTNMLRGLGASSDGVAVRTVTSSLGQNVFNAATVFNYYPPDNQISNGKLGPEFGIQNSAAAIGRANLIYSLVMSNGIAPDVTVQGATGTSIDWTPWQALAATPSALVDRLSWVFVNGALSATAQQKVVDAVNAIAATDTLGRARMAAYLVLNSSQFQVER